MRTDLDLYTPLCGILEAGMGGVARSELVAAVTGADGYGFLGMVREPPHVISREIDAVRARTEQPFGVNLVPVATNPVLLEAELAICIEKKIHFALFFWNVRTDVIARAKSAGCRVLYQVGSVEDAIASAEAGADVVIAQGFEAGGHVRATISSLVLLPQVVRAVSVPVVASGGFATGESLIAALALGAQGIHCGTAFLATTESFAHAYHKIVWCRQSRRTRSTRTLLPSIGLQLSGPAQRAVQPVAIACPRNCKRLADAELSH